jgi:hypothetical protein
MHIGDRVIEPLALTTIALSVGVVSRRLLFAIAAVGTGALVIARYVIAVKRCVNARQKVNVDQRLVRPQVVRGRPVTHTIEINVDTPCPYDIDVTVDMPPGFDEVESTILLQSGEMHAETEVELTSSVVGEHLITAPTITIEPLANVCTVSFTAGESITLRSLPEPTDVRIRRGDERSSAAFGIQGGGEYGEGLDPAELREYNFGDPLRHIDWNTTARQNEPFVREFEPETDSDFMLCLYHGEAMDIGIPGQTMLDYAKEVGLGIIALSESEADPTGFCHVDGEGTLGYRPPTTQAGGYRYIRDVMSSLGPNAYTDPPALDVPDRVLDAADRDARLRRLENETQFGQTLTHFYHARMHYRAVNQANPLISAIEHISSVRTDETHLCMISGDHDRASLYAAAQLADQRFDMVSLFITPTVLYDPAALATPADAYTEYQTFETFRRKLERLSAVRAFEVAPGDRLESLLTMKQSGGSI